MDSDHSVDGTFQGLCDNVTLAEKNLETAQAAVEGRAFEKLKLYVKYGPKQDECPRDIDDLPDSITFHENSISFYFNPPCKCGHDCWAYYASIPMKYATMKDEAMVARLLEDAHEEALAENAEFDKRQEQYRKEQEQEELAEFQRLLAKYSPMKSTNGGFNP